jgi:hypothetical protein
MRRDVLGDVIVFISLPDYYHKFWYIAHSMALVKLKRLQALLLCFETQSHKFA